MQSAIAPSKKVALALTIVERNVFVAIVNEFVLHKVFKKPSVVGREAQRICLHQTIVDAIAFVVGAFRFFLRI